MQSVTPASPAWAELDAPALDAASWSVHGESTPHACALHTAAAVLRRRQVLEQRGKEQWVMLPEHWLSEHTRWCSHSAGHGVGCSVSDRISYSRLTLRAPHTHPWVCTPLACECVKRAALGIIPIPQLRGPTAKGQLCRAELHHRALCTVPRVLGRGGPNVGQLWRANC